MQTEEKAMKGHSERWQSAGQGERPRYQYFDFELVVSRTMRKLISVV